MGYYVKQKFSYSNSTKKGARPKTSSGNTSKRFTSILLRDLARLFITPQHAL